MTKDMTKESELEELLKSFESYCQKELGMVLIPIEKAIILTYLRYRYQKPDRLSSYEHSFQSG